VRIWILVLFVVMLVRGFSLAADDVKPGLVGEYHELDGGVADFPKLPAEKKPTLRRVDKQINVENCTENFNNTNLNTNFYVKWAGSVKIEKAGKYKFFVESDDGSRLFIDGKQVLDNNGSHPMQKKDGEIELAPGQHEVKLEFFQGDGQMGCKFSWAPPGKNEEIVPEGVLWHKADAE
jgi:hypothetical protein